MEETIEKLTTQRDTLSILLYQIEDYLSGAIPAESTPHFIMYNGSKNLLHIREAVSILMRNADDTTKTKIKEILK